MVSSPIKIASAVLVAILGVSSAYAKKAPVGQTHQLTADQATLIQKAVGQEKILIKSIQQRKPLVETHIQDTRPDVKLYTVPVGDQYMLSRVAFGKVFVAQVYKAQEANEKRGWLKGSLAAITDLTKALGLDKHFAYKPNGFMQMMFLDPTGFDEQHYTFSFVRREFLGTLRTWVFDVHPKIAGMGRFHGRIWIEDRDGNIVRFNGTYTGPHSEDESRYYLHLDSWRVNVSPGISRPLTGWV